MRFIAASLAAFALMLTTRFCVADPVEVLTNAIANVANKLPGPYYVKEKNPETLEERALRMKMISSILAEESFTHPGWQWDATDLGWAAFVKTWNESARFKIEVHNGKMRGDHGKSVCLGQIMNGGEELVGVDEASTRRCISRVMDILIQHQIRCVDGYAPGFIAMADIFSGYGTGRSCKSSVFFYRKDSKGNIVLDKHGQPTKIFWAKDRARMWLLLRRGEHPMQLGENNAMY